MLHTVYILTPAVKKKIFIRREQDIASISNLVWHLLNGDGQHYCVQPDWSLLEMEQEITRSSFSMYATAQLCEQSELIALGSEVLP